MRTAMKIKPILLATITILSVASLAIMGTYADFSDIETSEDNYFATGEFNLRLENPDGIGEQWDESVLGTWHYEQKDPPSDPNQSPWYGRMKPGDSVNSYIYLEADGTMDGNTIDIYCSNVNEEIEHDTGPENEAEDAICGYDVPIDPGNGVFDKDTKMIITFMQYHTTTIITSEYDYDINYFTDTSGDGRISLDEFEAQPLLGLTPVPNNGTITFFMIVEFALDAGNEYQGDRTNMTLMFALIQ